MKKAFLILILFFFLFPSTDQKGQSPHTVTPIQGPIFIKNGSVPVVPLFSYPTLNNGSFVQIPVSFQCFFFRISLFLMSSIIHAYRVHVVDFCVSHFAFHCCVINVSRPQTLNYHCQCNTNRCQDSFSLNYDVAMRFLALHNTVILRLSPNVIGYDKTLVSLLLNLTSFFRLSDKEDTHRQMHDHKLNSYVNSSRFGTKRDKRIDESLNAFACFWHAIQLI